MLIEQLDSGFNADWIYQELMSIVLAYNLMSEPQISVQSILGDNDFLCSTGKIHNLKHPERYYKEINKAFKNTYTEFVLSRYPEYYRWRFLRLKYKESYTVHTDAGDKADNWRIHIPVRTNPDAFFCHYSKLPEDGKTANVRFYHLEAGNSYLINTTKYHSAVNYGQDDRWHLVGLRYTKSDK